MHIARLERARVKTIGIKGSALNRRQSRASNGPAFSLSANLYGFKTSECDFRRRPPDSPEIARITAAVQALNQQTIRAESIKQVAGHHRQADLLPEPPFKPIPTVNGWPLLEYAHTPALRSDRSWTC